MLPRRNPATKQLKKLMDGNFSIYEAMELINNGANPNTKDDAGNTLLHKITDILLLDSTQNNPDKKNECITAIYELLYTYNITVCKNNAGINPIDELTLIDAYTFISEALQVFFNTEYNDNNASNANSHITENNSDPISLIEDEYTTYFSNNNLSHMEMIEHINAHRIEYRETIQPLKTDFLNLLVLIANDIHNQQSTSFFRKLPVEIILNIIKYLDFSTMNKTWIEATLLAGEVFKQYQETIKPMLSTPGGINVFQSHDDKTNAPSFRFFKSAKTLCLDYDKSKSELREKFKLKHPKLSHLPKAELSLTSNKTLKKFKKEYAKKYWEEHSSLFSNPASKRDLYNSIEHHELYKGINLLK